MKKGPYTQKALQHYKWVEGKTTLTCLPEIQKIYHKISAIPLASREPH